MWLEATLELDRAKNSTEMGQRVIGGRSRENGRAQSKENQWTLSTLFESLESMSKTPLWEAKSDIRMPVG